MRPGNFAISASSTVEIAFGQIAVDAAHAQVIGVHARAAGRLLQVENVLAQVEAVKEHRDGAEIDAVRAELNAVRGDAREFGLHHANGLRARRDLFGDAQQLFDGEHVAERVRRGREVIHALHVGLRLRPKQVLAVFLDAGVQVSDLGIEP